MTGFVARARKAKTQPRTLFEIDDLAGVDGRTRIGALRFMDTEDGPFLTMTGEPFPPLINLPRLLSATDRIERDEETEEDLLLVLAPVLRFGCADRAGRWRAARTPHILQPAARSADPARELSSRFKIAMFV